MIKGFIHFKDGRIPFVLSDYRMELFTDDPLLSDFCKEYNFKTKYILEGECFLSSNYQSQRIVLWVESSMGADCELIGYVIENYTSKVEFTEMGFESHTLDSVFRYAYQYIDLARQGVNLAAATHKLYRIPFTADGKSYEMTYRIGHDERLGLMEDRSRKGEIIIPIKGCTIIEYYTLATVFQRLSIFMTSENKPAIKNVNLYHDGHYAGRFYCRYHTKQTGDWNDVRFYEFDVMKYIPKILGNIALNTGTEITHSVPLGHFPESGDLFSPHRFMEQMTAFEYLFDKIDHKKAQDKGFSLKDELQMMFDSFPSILHGSRLTSVDVSEKIKEIRRKVVHGYTYFYDFNTDSEKQYYIICMDKLIRAMSLKVIGFSDDEIGEYITEVPY